MINRLKTREFHFVLNNVLKSKISELARLINLSLSKTIIFVIESSSAIENKIHLTYKEENCKSEKIDWDSHIHVYFPSNKKSLYNKLKSIHKDNDTYSIANKLRYIISVFIHGIEIYGLEKFLIILEKAEKKWNNAVKMKKVWYKDKKVRQLSRIPYLKILYDVNYSPILLKFQT